MPEQILVSFFFSWFVLIKHPVKWKCKYALINKPSTLILMKVSSMSINSKIFKGFVEDTNQILVLYVQFGLHFPIIFSSKSDIGFSVRFSSTLLTSRIRFVKAIDSDQKRSLHGWWILHRWWILRDTMSIIKQIPVNTYFISLNFTIFT